MIAVAIPRCEASVIDGDETASGRTHAWQIVGADPSLLELLIGFARGAAEGGPRWWRGDVAADRRRRLSR
jgi:hypothetical protein